MVRRHRTVELLPAGPSKFALFMLGLLLAGTAVFLAWVLVNLDSFLATVLVAFMVAAGAML